MPRVAGLSKSPCDSGDPRDGEEKESREGLLCRAQRRYRDVNQREVGPGQPPYRRGTGREDPYTPEEG